MNLRDFQSELLVTLQHSRYNRTMKIWFKGETLWSWTKAKEKKPCCFLQTKLGGKPQLLTMYLNIWKTHWNILHVNSKRLILSFWNWLEWGLWDFTTENEKMIVPRNKQKQCRNLYFFFIFLLGKIKTQQTMQTKSKWTKESWKERSGDKI